MGAHRDPSGVDRFLEAATRSGAHHDRSPGRRHLKLVAGGEELAVNPRAAWRTNDEQGPRVEILEYADSSARGGDEGRVVGYLSAAIYTDHEPGGAAPLSSSEKDELLLIARTAVERIVRENRVLEMPPESRALRSPSGAFVTLRLEGRLRGCIGFVEPIAPLYKTVTLAAIYAATRDNRFPPVRPAELGSLELEISVLSTPRKIQDPDRVQVGIHGLIITRGERSGLLLPQVPVDNGWDRLTFLRQACQKAGLPQDAWRTGAEIFVFEAQVFR